MQWFYRLLIPDDVLKADRVKVAVDYWENLTHRLFDGEKVMG